MFKTELTTETTHKLRMKYILQLTVYILDGKILSIPLYHVTSGAGDAEKTTSSLIPLPSATATSFNSCCIIGVCAAIITK